MDQANPEDIAATYATARAWAQHDPEAGRAEQQLRREVWARHGIDLDTPSADLTAVREAVERVERARALAGSSRGTSAVEQGGAALLMAQADAAERGADRARAGATGTGVRADRAEAYDSSTRREAMTVALVDARVDRETAAKRMRADVSQALPAAAATATAGVMAPRARRTGETSPSSQRGAAQR